MFKIEILNDIHYNVSSLDGTKLNDKWLSILVHKNIIDKPIQKLIDESVIAAKEQNGMLGYP